MILRRYKYVPGFVEWLGLIHTIFKECYKLGFVQPVTVAVREHRLVAVGIVVYAVRLNLRQLVLGEVPPPLVAVGPRGLEAGVVQTLGHLVQRLPPPPRQEHGLPGRDWLVVLVACSHCQTPQ